MPEVISIIIGTVIISLTFALLEILFKYIDEKQFERDLITLDEIEILKNDDEIDRYIKYFQKIIGKPYKRYRIPLKKYKQFKHSYRDISTIRNITHRLLMHLGSPCSYMHIKINQCYSHANAGEYSNNIVPQITINLKEHFSYMNLLAILCHECTHHFMHIHNIYCDDNMDNEKMTDALAIYLGFDKYIELGYMPQKIIKQKTNFVTNDGATNYRYDIHTSSIGYLDESRVNYTIHRVKHLRKKYFLLYILEKVNLTKHIYKKLKLLRSNSVKQLKSSFDEAYDIYTDIINRHREIIDILVCKKTKKMDTDAIKAIQDYFSYSFELKYVIIAKDMKKQRNSKDIKKGILKKYILQVKVLSATLTEINVNLSKYL